MGLGNDILTREETPTIRAHKRQVKEVGGARIVVGKGII